MWRKMIIFINPFNPPLCYTTLYDNLDKDVELALGVYDVVENNAQDNWRELKARRLRLSRAVGHYTGFDDDRLNALMGIIASNEEFQ